MKFGRFSGQESFIMNATKIYQRVTNCTLMVFQLNFQIERGREKGRKREKEKVRVSMTWKIPNAQSGKRVEKNIFQYGNRGWRESEWEKEKGKISKRGKSYYYDYFIWIVFIWTFPLSPLFSLTPSLSLSLSIPISSHNVHSLPLSHTLSVIYRH